MGNFESLMFTISRVREYGKLVLYLKRFRLSGLCERDDIAVKVCFRFSFLHVLGNQTEGWLSLECLMGTIAGRLEF